MDFIGDDVVKALLLTLLLFFVVVLVVCSDLVVFLRPQNWTLEIWTVLRLMCNEVVSKVKGGGSQGDLTGLQSQGNPQPMHLPRLQRDQPH